MKKYLISTMIIACAFVVGLAGCAKEEEPLANTIAPKTITADHADILRLIVSKTLEVQLFEYKTDGGFENAEFWVEVYENGTLKNVPVRANVDVALAGEMAVIIAKNKEFHWTITTRQDNSLTSYSNDENTETIDDSLSSWGETSMDEPVVLEKDKEILLNVTIFANEEIRLYEDLQGYIKQPELIKDYPVVHFIKCKFN